MSRRETASYPAKRRALALARIGQGIQWVQSYVAGDKTFCVYLAENEELIMEHARISDFPANEITEIVTIIDPSTAGAPAAAL